MPGIEYSPNARASCQGCHCQIPNGNVRVSVKAQSPYTQAGRRGFQRGYFSGDCITKYYHAECYTNKTEFTKFYGFYSLKREDQHKYLTKEQKEKIFGPEKLVEKALSSIPNDNDDDDEFGDASFLDNFDVDAAVALARPIPATDDDDEFGDASFLDNFDVDAAVALARPIPATPSTAVASTPPTPATPATNEKENTGNNKRTTDGASESSVASTTPSTLARVISPTPAKKKAKTTEQSFNITITGLKYHEAKAKPNEKIKLRREPENVSVIFLYK